MRIGIVGFGVMGRNHFRVLKSIPSATIGAIVEPTLEEGEFKGVMVFDSIEKMSKNASLDALIIAVPTPLHESVSLKAIELGYHLLIEKPISQTSESGRKIEAAAKAKGVKCAIGHVERFNPVVQTLKNELKDKEIYSISITRVGPFPPRMANVGVLTDLSVHDLDLVRFVSTREFKDMRIFKSQKIHNHSEDNAEISFLLDNDIVGNITTNWLTPFKRRRIEVSCKEAFYEADLISQELMEYSQYQKNNSYLTRWCFVQKGEPLRRELKAFIEFINNGEDGHLATLEDSIKTLDILERYA
ncbi:MAG: Gfo/Idh/MocA family protein [Campylobacterales bacterium]